MKVPVSPTEAKESLVSHCQELQRLFEGHSVPARKLLLGLREQLAPLVELGLHRTDIYDTIRSSGLRVSSAHVFEVLRTLFGPSRLTHRSIPADTTPAPSATAHESFLTTNANSLDSSKRNFSMTFGSEEEAAEQQERLTRARTKIEAERERKRIQTMPPQDE